jgi:hypothetical protein
MLIRYGYEITVNCAQPTPMVCLLSVSEDRKADIRVDEKVFTTPIIPTTTYLDTFGNRCRRLVAPAGDFAIWGDATIEDDGKIDPANFAAVEVPVAELPDSCLLYLMGSRYCETDKLSQTAWDLFGKLPSGWGRVQDAAPTVPTPTTPTPAADDKLIPAKAAKAESIEAVEAEPAKPIGAETVKPAGAEAMEAESIKVEASIEPARRSMLKMSEP